MCWPSGWLSPVCSAMRLFGDHQTLNVVFKDARFNGWSIGEIFAIDKLLVPNARRDIFEKNPAYFALFEQLMTIAAGITKDVRAASLKRNTALSSAIEQLNYNGPPVKTTHEKIIANQIIPYQPILSPEPPCYRSAQRNCPADQGCLDRLGLAGTMALARCPQLLNPLRTLAAAAQPARTRLSRSVACDAKQLW